MATRAPTVSGRWGEAPYAQFDYWRNPTRIGVDPEHQNGQNPCIFHRHGGGGVGGHHQTLRNDNYGDPFFVLHWLSGGVTGSAPATKWDLCSFSSGQQLHAEFFTPFIAPYERSRSLWFPDPIRDHQRAVASIKGQAVSLGFNPRKVVGWGDSYGGTVMGLSMLAPTLGGTGRRGVWRDSTNFTTNHDSTLRGAVLQQPQIDCRNISGTDYLASALVAGWFGTRLDSGTEFAAIPAAVRSMASLRAYIEAGETDGYQPWYLAYVSGVGTGVKPLTDPHDTVQLTDLSAALTARGLTHGTNTRAAAAWANASWPNAPGAGVLALYQPIETFLAARIL